jgi:thiol-disulfide isomerase/thioredoxin
LAQKEIVKVSNTVATSAYPESMPPVYENFEEMASIFNQETDTTYIINFWATWCKPCVEELPYFEQLTEQYKNQKVKVILVSLDFKKQLATKLLPFIKERNIQSEVVVLLDPDANAWVNRVDPSWSGAIPVTLVYKKDKRAFYEESFEDLAALDNIVKPFL